MYQKKIKYEGFDGEVEETFYFNMNAVEAKRFVESDLGKKIEKISQQSIEEIDETQAMTAIEDVILLAYGKRDGDAFIKNDAVREEFRSSMPFGELVTQMLSDDTAMAEFFIGIMPKDKRDLVRSAFESAGMDTVHPPEPEPTAEIKGKPELPGVDHEAKTITKAAFVSLQTDIINALVADGYTVVS